MYYDLEAINRFIDTISKNEDEIYRKLCATKKPMEPAARNKKIVEGLDRVDVLAAARALAAVVVAGVDLKKELGITKRRGPKTRRKFDMTIHSPEFMVLCSLEGGAIKYHEAVEFLMSEFFAEKTAAEEFIRDRRDSAKNYVTNFRHPCEDERAFLMRDELKTILNHRKHK